MSLFSRFFRKAPPLPVPSRETPSASAPAPVAPSEPDRSLAMAAEESALQAAIEGRDAATVARLVVEGTSTKVRQQAAHAIDDPAILRQLIRDVRGGNDKSVYKILTSKRDSLLEQTRALEQQQAEVNAAAAAIERHSRRSYDPLFTPTLEQLEIRWKSVSGNAAPELVRQVQQAIDLAREVIAQHLRQIAVEASRQLAAANAAAEAQRVRELEEKAQAATAAERAATLAAQRKAEAEKQEAEATAIRQLGGLIRKAQRALQEGSTGRTAGLRRAIDEKLATVTPVPAYITNQLQHLDEKLNELKDWKNFSVAPKRIELMEEMESLIGASLEPVALAGRIKDLQEQWRTLSKGAGENVEADWQRFQDAAHKAFEPCREYYDAQALARQENLQRREALLARLTAFEAGHNWEQPDWRTVTTALRESKLEWRRHSPVERAAGKPLQEKFDTVSAALQSRLDAEHARNVKEKKLLIERAQRLLTGEDTRKAIEDVKELQQNWKSVGPVPRDVDHSLWEEFRQHCDAVFQRRQQEYSSYTAGLEANKVKAVGLCERVESVAALSGPELLQAAQTLPDLRAAFEEIREFPRSDSRALRGRFERALDRCEESIARQHSRDAERSWNDLFDAANHIRALRLAKLGNGDAAQLDALRQAAEGHIASVSRWPKGALEAVNQSLAADGAGADVGANELALRMLCIRAEILTDKPSPAEDQILRREYQVQRLVQAMGQGIRAEASQLDTLALEWVRVGPVDAASYQTLVTRFRQCRER